MTDIPTSRGVASSIVVQAAERQSLSALCGGKAALYTLVLILATTAGAFGQTPTPSPEPSLDIPVPAIAPDYKPEERPLPELGRVGVDMDRQRPLTLREALALALE